MYVEVARGALRTIEGPPSTPELAAYLDRLGLVLEPGWRVEINLRAVEWIRAAARSLTRGFIIVIDYGHEARELYSVTHAGGTLTTFARHTMAGPERPADAPAWLEDAGEQDITAHVDFTSVRMAAEAEGLTTIGFLDQTYFLMGLGAAALDVSDLKNRLALKTLLMPGGLGSTHKVLILGKGVGTPALAGCSYPGARYMSPMAVVGLLVMVVSEAATLAKIEPFWSWNTPIAWTGFIVFADAMVFRARGDSWMRSSPREFVALTLASIPLWIVFEGYNLVDQGTGITSVSRRPPGPQLRIRVVVRHDLADESSKAQGDRGVARCGTAPGRTEAPRERCRHGRDALGRADAGLAVRRFSRVAVYLAAPVWLNFILLLDPPERPPWAAESLMADLARNGNRDRLVNLLVSGMLCGGLWEFWNYWSRAKWHYTVPILERYKIFEMPLPGYLGFGAFALECFTMYVFVRRLVAPLGRRIAL